MFSKFGGRALAIGTAITTGAITFISVKAKIVANEKLVSDVKTDSIDSKLQLINNNLDLSRSESIINSCITRLSQWRQINDIPGLVVGVSLKGQNVWIYSDGFSDVENGVKCSDKTVMRIASISKSMTALLMAKLIQEKRIDLDKPINQYLTRDQFPDKYWEGNKVDITLRQLASHLGGIRHYKKESEQQKNNKPKGEDSSAQAYQLGEFSLPEYYLKDTFHSVIDSLNLFKDDPLVSKPGTKYSYTTFGYTLISAVIETQLNGQKFDKYFIKFLREELGLDNTYLDQNDPIILNRSKFYVKGPNGRLMNAPYVDNSYKWAGGGLLSNVYDLLKFGNIMLYSFKGGVNGKPGLIKKEIIDQMWTQSPNTQLDWDKRWGGYGLGWGVIRGIESKYAFCSEPPFPTIISHVGGAIGASSVILIEPNSELIVTIITNSQNVSGIYTMAVDIAKQFNQKDSSSQQLLQLLNE